MAKSKDKTAYVCSTCGVQSVRWYGKCPSCGEWDSLSEQITQTAETVSKPRPESPRGESAKLDAIGLASEERTGTGYSELDRVLGGGAVLGSLVLFGGDPGIGKSTLLLQAAAHMAASSRVLYVSGEESPRQIKMRAARLGLSGGELHIMSQTNFDTILEHRESLEPDFLIIDSIQTVYRSGSASSPGSVSQVRACTSELMQMAKRTGCTCFLVGHVTKDGTLAGPRVMEHMVDAVLLFEGDRNHEYRILRAVKNRFGSTGEIGVFLMDESGMRQVANPSELFLSSLSQGEPGSAVACAVEGTRPVLVDIQALAGQTMLQSPRRQAYGFDFNRMALLLAVLEKRMGMKLYQMDVYVNIAGGMELSEPSADLPLIAAVASSYTDKALPKAACVMGEVGLSGEVRAVGHMQRRVDECARMGFSMAVVPFDNLRQIRAPEGLKIHGVKSVAEALRILLGKGAD